MKLKAVKFESMHVCAKVYLLCFKGREKKRVFDVHAYQFFKKASSTKHPVSLIRDSRASESSHNTGHEKLQARVFGFHFALLSFLLCVSLASSHTQSLHVYRCSQSTPHLRTKHYISLNHQ